MPLLVLIGVGLWFLFGSPTVTIANWFWENDAAPWETVDLYYYPDRNDLRKEERYADFESVEGCRRMAYAVAASRNDPGLRRGGYECGIQQTDTFGGIRVYRATAR